MEHRILQQPPTRFDITLLEGRQTSDINKETKLKATGALTNANGSSYPANALWEGWLTIKGRGNSTWLNPKRPYNITLTDSAFKKVSVGVMGMPADSDWSILTDYYDKTFLRNIISSALSYALGLPWASRMRKVELYINGAYQGLYTFAEKVKVAPHRIAIDAMVKADISGEMLTGGYVIEKQALYQISEAEGKFQDEQFGWWHSFKAPDGEDIVPEQTAYAKSRIDAFHDALMNHPLDDLGNGYRAHIKPEFYAKYFLLQDLKKNLDGYNNSAYTTKRRGDGLLEAGPDWDSDNSLGITHQADWTGMNVDWAKPNDTVMAAKSPVMGRLMQDPYFRNLVQGEFKNALQKIHEVITDLETFAVLLEASGAPDRDRATWPEPVGKSDLIPQENYYAEAQRVIKFLKDRVHYHTRSLYDVVPRKPLVATAYPLRPLNRG